MKTTKTFFVLIMMSVGVFCASGFADTVYEAIRTPQFDQGPYAVSILLVRTDRFQNPRDAVYNELGKDIEGEPLKLLIVDTRNGAVVCLFPVSGVPKSVLEDESYGHTFDNASILDISWGPDTDEFLLSQSVQHKALTAERFVLTKGRFLKVAQKPDKK